MFIATPYEGQRPVLEQVAPHLASKVVVNVVAPMSFSRGRAAAIAVEDGSAAMEAQRMLPDSAVVGAFQNISAVDLIVPDG